MPSLFKHSTSTLLGRTFRDAHCEKCGTDYRYVLACKGHGFASSFILSPADKAEEIATRESAEDLAKQLSEDIAAVPCPRCGWLQPEMVQKLREESGTGFALLGWLACLAGAIGFVVIPFLAYRNWLLPQHGAAAQMRLTAIASAGLLLGGAGLLYFVRWRANQWNPNDGDRTERRALGRKLAVALDECSPEDLEKLLAAVDGEQQREIQNEHSGGLRFAAGACAIFAVAGIGFLVSEAPVIASAIDTFRWPSVTGQLQSAAVQSEKRGKHSYYFPVVAYDYEVEGVAYRGTRYALDKDDSLTHDGANVTVQQLLAAPDALVVYYDPQSPGDSLLQRGLPLLKSLFIVVCAVMAIGGGVLAIRNFSKSRQPFHPDEVEITLP